MLVAAIFILLLLSALAASIMHWRHVALPRVWMLMAFIGVLLWLAVLAIPHEGTVVFSIKNWFSSDTTRINLDFSINSKNWAMVFSLVTIHLAFLYTSGSKQELNRDFPYWVIETGMIALAYFTVTAADLWTVIIAWTAMDISGLGYEVFMRREISNLQVILPLAFKLLGSLILIYATAISSNISSVLMLDRIPVSTSGWFFTAAVLHSGIFPFRFPSSEKIETGTATNYLSYLISFISSLFLIVYLPVKEIRFLPFLALSLLSIAGMIYFGLFWVRVREESRGVYFLSAAFISLAIFRFVTGTHQDLDHWLPLTLLAGSWLVLFSHRGKSTQFLPIILLISMLGIPFTLTSYGSSLLFASGFKLSAIFILVFHVFYLAGFYFYLTVPKENFDDLDSSSQMNYLLAILFTVLAVLLASYRSAGSILDEITNWWACLPAIATLAFLIFRRRRGKVESPVQLEKNDQLKVKESVITVLSFNWLVKVLEFVSERLQVVVRAFSNLMEGEGGILWSIVFLALLATLLRTGG